MGLGVKHFELKDGIDRGAILLTVKGVGLVARCMLIIDISKFQLYNSDGI